MNPNLRVQNSGFLLKFRRSDKVMRAFSLYSFLILSLLLVSTCNKRLIRKDDLSLINEHYAQNTYYLKENLVIDSKEVIKKDTSVKIWIESTPSVLKVKCYKVNEDRESAVGKLVSYLVNDDFKGKNFTVENLDDLISQKLEYYDSKEFGKSKVKK